MILNAEDALMGKGQELEKYRLLYNPYLTKPVRYARLLWAPPIEGAEPRGEGAKQVMLPPLALLEEGPCVRIVHEVSSANNAPPAQLEEVKEESVELVRGTYSPTKPVYFPREAFQCEEGLPWGEAVVASESGSVEVEID